MDLLDTTTAMQIIQPFWDTVARNISGIFLLIGVIVAISVVMAIIDTLVGEKVHDVFGKEYRIR